jgi:hypothetical protein
MSLSTITADTLLRSLALSIARNAVGAMRPLSEVLAAEGMVQSEYDLIAQNSQFKRYVDAYTADLKENGYSFAAKSKVLAEDLLPTAYHMARDPETPAAVRAKILENLVEWADLKPKKVQENVGGPSFSITFNLPGALPHVEVVKNEVADAIPKELASLPSFHTPEKRPSPIVFDEPDSYEYAGEDFFG